MDTSHRKNVPLCEDDDDLWYDDILGSFDGYFAQAKLAEAEKETIPKLKQQVSDLQSVNEGLSAQITQAQLALCDVYELVIGG